MLIQKSKEYGYLGLEADANTVIGLNFYEHSETPGLGARVSDPTWLDQWREKKIHDSEGNLRIGVARWRVAADSPAAAYEVDGLSGATRTSRSVHHILRFWLGSHIGWVSLSASSDPEKHQLR